MSRTARIVLGASILLSGAAMGARAETVGSLAPRNDSRALQQWVADPRTNCRALDSNYDPYDSITWQGSCSAAGMASGQGTLIFYNHGKEIESITGTFDGGVLQAGQVTASWADGSRYEGSEAGGQFDGHGVFTSANGDRLEGDWKAGALNGKAQVLWANGDRYDGDWTNGKSDGQGTEVWANGDRYTGQWKNGKANGHGMQVWKNGQSYDGAWSDDVPNGQGLLVRPGGTRYQGLFVDGKPATGTSVASTDRNTDAAAAPPVLTPAVEKTGDTDARQSQNLPFQALLGQKLAAIDGSTIVLDAGDGGMTRTITLPNGAVQETSFSFMNDRLGTVSASATAVGLFRVNSDAMDIDYTDGHTESLRAVPSNGLALSLRAPDGTASCAVWYPETHVFSAAERQAAVEEYASRLGVASPIPRKKHAPAKHGGACVGGLLAAAPEISTNAPAQPAPAIVPIAKPITAAHESRPIAAPGAPATDTHASLPANGLQRVAVRPSPIHTIDPPPPPPAPTQAQQAKFTVATALASPQAVQPASGPDSTAINASQCLSVTSDGQYWGFQNRCAKTLQFSYCEMGNNNPLTSCGHTTVAGSVAANSFSPLVSDTSLKEKDIKHDFRWMACDGGAGEVVAHLDSSDPPVGRCDRLKTADE